MPENKIDQHLQQTADISCQQSIQHTSDSDLDKRNIKVEEIEEWDVVATDQRRPQFGVNENYGRRNYQM